MLMHELLASMPQRGRVEWIGLRPDKRAALTIVERVEALENRGLAGDHRSQREGGKRQVTLIQAEHLPMLAALTGHEQIPPEWLRRNIVVSGINLFALRDRRFLMGDVILEGTGTCPPCSRMEKTLGAGGYNAMRGHGGITVQVVSGGEIHIGAEVRLLEAQAQAVSL
ncbi:MOSC domain-containing protein [Sulfuriflexus mobilis]|uniref:MOSC domain-containing protein n=1 Tax=Sulfuriflexus mobilis TaxID=1811807 RepID=UPI0015595674|nr:MOSC domain-containing protein [Sulfuriflexus mobilis]